ncbi:unnamed protein product [Sphagnum balticum]
MRHARLESSLSSKRRPIRLLMLTEKACRSSWCSSRVSAASTNGKLADEGDIVPSNQPSSPPSFYSSSVAAKEALAPRSPRTVNGEGSGSKTSGVKFILTDIYPHIPDWTEAAKRSANLSFVGESVDAANAPCELEWDGWEEDF